MKPEIKQKWIEALRSGKYKQGRFNLFDSDSNTFCCLGVLGDVVGISRNDMDGRGWRVIEDSNLLSGLQINTCIKMNDASGCSFTEIADYVEANLL